MKRDDDLDLSWMAESDKKLEAFIREAIEAKNLENNEIRRKMDKHMAIGEDFLQAAELHWSGGAPDVSSVVGKGLIWVTSTLRKFISDYSAALSNQVEKELKMALEELNKGPNRVGFAWDHLERARKVRRPLK
jgi:uncharacterized membrane protein